MQVRFGFVVMFPLVLQSWIDASICIAKTTQPEKRDSSDNYNE